MSDFNLNIPIKPGNINQNFIVNHVNFKKIVDDIKKIDKVDKLNELIKTLGLHDYISFNNNVDITYAKNIVETLVLITEVFKNFNSNNTVEIGKLFGLIKTPENFSQIMRNTMILPRYHQLVVDFVLKTISDKKFAIIRTHTMNSIPETIIQYLQAKPSSKDLNFCNISEEFLIQLRKDRSITNEEFNKYLQQSYLVCDPNKVKIADMKSVTIPINEKKGLAVVDRVHNSYDEFVKETKEIDKTNKNIIFLYLPPK